MVVWGEGKAQQEFGVFRDSATHLSSSSRCPVNEPKLNCERRVNHSRNVRQLLPRVIAVPLRRSPSMTCSPTMEHPSCHASNPADITSRLRELEAFRARAERRGHLLRRLLTAAACAGVLATVAVSAAQSRSLLACKPGSSLICFVSGEAARAADVNHNFAALENAQGELAQRVEQKIGSGSGDVVTGTLTATTVRAGEATFSRLSSGPASFASASVSGTLGVGDRVVTNNLTVNGSAALGYKIVSGPNVVVQPNAKWDMNVDCGAGFRVVAVGSFVQAPHCGRATGYSLPTNGGQGWTMAMMNQCGERYDANVTAVCLRVQ